MEIEKKDEILIKRYDKSKSKERAVLMYNKIVPSDFFESKTTLQQKVPKKHFVNTSFKSHTVMSERNPFNKKKQLQSLDTSAIHDKPYIRPLPKIKQVQESGNRGNFVTIQVLSKGPNNNIRNTAKEAISNIPKTSELPVLRQQKEKESILMKNEALRQKEDSPRVNISIGSSIEQRNRGRSVISSIPNHEKSPIFMKLFERFEKYKEKHMSELAEYYNLNRKIYKSQKMKKRIGSTMEERETITKYRNTLLDYME